MHDEVDLWLFYRSQYIANRMFGLGCNYGMHSLELANCVRLAITALEILKEGNRPNDQ
jgi:hypothetical protein